MGLMYANKYPLTDVQQMMLSYTSSNEHAGFYVVQMRVMLREEMDFDVFQLAWNQIIARHEMLRASVYGKEIGTALLAIHLYVNFAVDFIDFSKYSFQVKQDKLDCLLRVDLQQSFDLYHPPLMRVKLIKLSCSRYFLLWSHHHIILSSKSSIKVLHEVFEVYDQMRKGKTAQLPEVKSYSSFIEHLQQLDHASANRYWQETCKNFHPLPRLLFTGNDRDDTAISEIVTTDIVSISAYKLEQFCNTYELMPNIVVHGAWGLLLSIYANSADVIFGDVRSFKSIVNENLAGCFVNIMPVRSQLNMSNSVLDYLLGLKQQYDGFEPHIGASLCKMQQHDDLISDEPHFDTVINFVAQTPEEYFKEVDGKWKHRKVFYVAETNYPVTLLVWQEDGNFNFRIDYAANFYQAKIVERMLSHFTRILNNMLQNISQRVVDVEHLSPAEHKQILFDWNDTDVPYIFDKSVSQLFEEQVGLVPHNIAVVYNKENLTYLELNQKANQLARYMNKLNLPKGASIAVYIERSPAMIVAMMAIFKSGYVYLPISFDAPHERIEYIIKDAKVSLLISKTELNYINCCNFVIDRDWKNICNESSDNLSKINNAAYIIYTSGSTGKPKGVLIKEPPLLNLIYWHQRTYKINHNDRTTVVANEGFDVSVWEILAHLLSGAVLHLLDRELVVDYVRLVDYFEKHNITVSYLSSPVAELFFDVALNRKLSLRYLLVGSDRLSKRPDKKLTFKVMNHYGPTEATVLITSGEVLPNDNARKQSLPHIGKPIDNVKCYILDKMQRIVPVGVIGELYIGGIGLAEGYVGQPELTKQKFIDNPLSDIGGKLYRTGDLVRWLPDGNIDFIGRVDNQVKIRGYRIELSDIERNLEKYPSVNKCAVVVKNVGVDSKILVAYMMPQTQQVIDINAIKLFLAKSIPHYMIPSIFYEMQELPLTSNDKIDKRKLVEQAVVSAAPKMLPKTATENTILQILQKLLHIEDLSVEYNFFEIGLNSLTVVQLCHLLNDKLEMNLCLVDIFTHHSVRLLAEYVDHKNNECLYLAAIQQRVIKKRQRIYRNRNRTGGRAGFNRQASDAL
ncbi:MAG: amino acid adenylation domain-containing protein [Gammaproteobacteria bacterium]|jgi:microcystin synthetase protein McyB